jgi:hypothetical protein
MLSPGSAAGRARRGLADRQPAPMLHSLVLLAPLLLSPSTVQKSGELVDEDYRFRIEAPDEKWQVLDEDAARKIVPDAVAMLWCPPGLFCAVIVEHAPGIDLASMARTMLDGMPLEGAVEEDYRDVRFQDRSAVRFQVAGTIDGQRMRFQCTVFTNGDYLYQLMSWGALEVVDRDGQTFAPLLRSFDLLEGEPRGRRAVRATVDARGVGWDLRGGVFRSVPYRLRVEARDPWSLVTGSELEGMNAAAEVGLLCEQPDMYLVLIPERVVGTPAAAFAAQMRLDFAADKESLGEPIPARIAGTELALQPLRSPDAPQFTFVHGAFGRGDVCYQLQAWFLGPVSETALERLASACESIGFLDEAERATLALELVELGDPENEVAADFSLRGGVYRDYGAAFTWRKPAGLWRATTGQGARAEWGDGARLVLEEPTLSVLGVVSSWESPGVSPRQEHEENLWLLAEDLETTAPREVQVGGTAALDSEAWTAVDGTHYGYRLITAQAAGRSYSFLCYGLRENVAAARAAIDAARDAFVLGVAPALPGVRKGAYVDEKVGFSLARPGAGWKSDLGLVPGDAAGLGGSCGWSDGKGREVFAIALCALGPIADESGLQEMILDEIVRNTSAREELGTDTLAGLPCQRRSLRSPFGLTEVLTLRRDNTLFLFGVTSQSGSPTLDEAKGWFAFLP